MIARAGVGRMTIADADTVSESNINRQLIALHSTIGREKSELMAERLRDINPDIELTVVNRFIKDDETDALTSSTTLSMLSTRSHPSLLLSRVHSTGLFRWLVRWEQEQRPTQQRWRFATSPARTTVRWRICSVNGYTK